MKFRFPQCMAALLVMSWSAAAPAQQVHTGRFESGAYYHIQVPAGWQPQDGLVIWNHGFDLNPPMPVPGLGELAQIQLDAGFAVAATSYSLNGWALFQTIGDLRDLVHEFERRFGVPGKIYLTGGSMGGLVSIQALEAANLGNVVGVYSLCGALGGGRLWDAALDLRLAYDAVCADVSGADIAGAAKGLPFRIDPEDYRNEDLTDALGFLLGDRINACTGVLELPGNRTAAQQSRLDRLMAVLDLPNEVFFLTVMGFATAGLADLVYDPAKLDSAVGTSNIGVDYGDARLNQNIERVNANTLDRLALLNNYNPTGEVGAAKVLAIHTDDDGLVPVESLQAYAQVAPEASYAFAVVDERIPSHCGFTPAEGVAGWRALTDWVELHSPEPDAQGLQTRCQILQASGVEGPCRFAPDFEVAQLDTVIPPRDMPDYQVDGSIFGAWYNEGDPGEGWVLEYLGGGRVLVYWFTYPPTGGPGAQLWLTGVGTIEGNTVTATLLRSSGRPFGSRAAISLETWGEITFTFAGENSDATKGLVRWTGPPAFGTGHETITHLADRGLPLAIDPIPIGYFTNGSWFTGKYNGEGWHITVLGAESALVYWFTYDTAGNPAWLMGVGEINSATIDVDQMVLTGGAHFGADFDDAEVKQDPWGSLHFQFSGCKRGQVRFHSPLPGFGSGSRPIERLTIPPGSPCAP